jgi:hypothetical protein
VVSLNPDMKLVWLRIAVCGVLPWVAAWGAFAQTQATGASTEMQGVTVREIHPKAAPPMLFPLNAKTVRVEKLEFRAPEQMTAADRDLAEANQGEIARRAGLQGFDLERGAGWGYEQAVCPVFPQHLILEYSRDNGRGDVTLFSAVIPRGEGHVRVIPVRRRGYSLWTPASSNAITLNDFNHMVVEGHEGLSPDWLTLGLCYAALAGGHVRAALVAQTPAEEVYPLLTPAKLTVSGKGGAEMYFADATPHVKAMDWVLIFAQNGRLMKVKHTVSGEIVERPVAGTAVDITAGIPVKGAN